MLIIDYLIYILGVIYIVWDIEPLKYVLLAAFVLDAAIRITRSVIYSRKTFVCLECGEEFKLKPTDLLRTYGVWGHAGSKETVTKNGIEYRRLWVRCKKCGSINVGYKE